MSARDEELPGARCPPRGPRGDAPGAVLAQATGRQRGRPVAQVEVAGEEIREERVRDDVPLLAGDDHVAQALVLEEHVAPHPPALHMLLLERGAVPTITLLRTSSSAALARHADVLARARRAAAPEDLEV